MTLISFLLQRARAITLLALIAGAVAGFSNSVLLALINTAIANTGSAAAALVWSFVGICVLMLVSRVAAEVLLLCISQDAVLDLRLELSRRILAAPLRHLEELGAARLLATLTQDVPTIANALITIPVLCTQVTVVVGILIYLGILSWKLLLFLLGFMVVGALSYQLAMTKGMNYLRLAREQWDAMFNRFKEMTEGTKELKLHHRRRETFISKSLYPTAALFRRQNVRGQSILIAAASWGQLLFFIVLGLLIFVPTTATGASPQTMVGYTITILYMITPLQMILGMIPELGRANISLQKVNEMGLSLASRSTESDKVIDLTSEHYWNRLELKNLTHAYHTEKENTTFTLGPIDLTFRTGELVFLIGGNGSGKTTLAKLIMGLYTPETGEVRLDGEPITDQNREQYRQHFSVVFSDFYLFDSLLGLESPELDSHANDYLQKLQLDHKVELKEGALSTTKLSQGQRKRLALLTAYLENRPIYLFDEWAADQDPLFKDVFYLSLLPDLKARGKTVIVISHDDRYYHLADRLIKLDYGKIEYDRPVNGAGYAAFRAPSSPGDSRVVQP